MVANDSFEKDLISQGYGLICGADESGCGALIGDVYCSVVIFPAGTDYKKLLPGINDSKQKTPEQRDVLYDLIKEHASGYATATANVEEIDRLNIYWAKFLAFRRALEKLKISPDYVLMDGNKKIPEINIPQMAIVKGDGKSFSIAAASILAKVERDRYMIELSKQVNPEYDIEINKGYYTPKHIAALEKFGKTEYHRQKYVEKFLK